MIVTAILMGVATGKGETLSDEEIKFRAAKLGMVEEKPSVLTDLVTASPEALKPKEEPKQTEEPKTAEEPKQTEESKTTEEPKQTETPKSTEEPKVTEAPKVTAEPKVTEAPKTTEAPKVTEAPGTTDDTSETVTIEIKRGDSSVSLSRDLKEAGLIQDAKAYDKYLCNNGYDRKISVGVYQIPMGSSEEEIARIVTKSKK